ncbi:Hypothetical predicted protein [Pelobates cultripes]|uniref:Uncharacterized protein n=1 Tax=Pelobates cultripes TaxID=61616 RepID=A0AAD1WPF3_PELCU|nr:Hypothetical predicted protein [Pelobates cultripes]
MTSNRPSRNIKTRSAVEKARYKAQNGDNIKPDQLRHSTTKGGTSRAQEATETETHSGT